LLTRSYLVLLQYAWLIWEKGREREARGKKRRKKKEARTKDTYLGSSTPSPSVLSSLGRKEKEKGGKKKGLIGGRKEREKTYALLSILQPCA